MKKNINNQVYSLLAYVSQFGFSFGAFLVLIRILSPEDLGLWILYLTIFTIAEQARVGLIHNGYVKYYKAQKFSFDVLTSSTLLLGLGAGLLLALLVLILCWIIGWSGGNPHLIMMGALYPLFAILGTIQKFWETHWMATERFQHVAMTKSIYGVAFLSSIGIFMYGSQLSISYLPLLQMSSVALTLLVSWLFLQVPTTKYNYCLSCINELFNYGRYVLGTNISSIVLNKMDVFVLSALIGPVGVALYNAASKLINVIEIPLSSISQVVFPKISHSFHQSSVKNTGLVISQSTFITVSIMLPCGMLLFAFADTAIIWVAGETYQASTSILKVLAIATILKSIGRISGISLDAIGKPDWNYYLLISSVFINLGFSIVLFKLYGILGIALSTIVTLFFNTIASIYLLNRVIPITVQTVITSVELTFKSLINSYKNEISIRS